jgi:hypothetical protein
MLLLQQTSSEAPGILNLRIQLSSLEGKEETEVQLFFGREDLQNTSLFFFLSLTTVLRFKTPNLLFIYCKVV